MNNIKDKVILMDSAEAASIKTVTGWTSSDGRFFGNNEDLARYAGSTHRKCHNNPEHPIYRVNSHCDICYAEKRKANFQVMPRKPWEVRHRLELLYGDVKRIELFSRKNLEGWDVWGNECNQSIRLIPGNSEAA